MKAEVVTVRGKFSDSGQSSVVIRDKKLRIHREGFGTYTIDLDFDSERIEAVIDTINISDEQVEDIIKFEELRRKVTDKDSGWLRDFYFKATRFEVQL